MRSTKKVAALAGIAGMLAVPVTGSAAEGNLVQTAQGAGDFTTLVSLAKQAGLAGTLTGNQELTVLAPTDAAFAKLPKATLRELQRNPAALRQVLLYHVLPGEVSASQVVTLNAAKTASGQGVKIRVRGGKVRINSSRVVATDVQASNGVIHVIDRVLIPKKLPRNRATLPRVAAKDDRFTTFTSLVKAAGLTKALSGRGKLTVFAPTDAAFAKVPKATLDALAADTDALREVLTYHVIAGDKPASKVVKLRAARTLNHRGVRIRVRGKRVFVNNARVVDTNIRAKNGTIHAINRVLLPPTLRAVEANLAEVATGAGQFSTLVKLVVAADLLPALTGDDPLTVFAPTDAAFAKVPPATLDALLGDKAKLQRVLKYHILSGQVLARQVVKLDSATTLDGTDVAISANGGVKVNNANVIAVNARAKNGVIHVIDEVLIPPNL